MKDLKQMDFTWEVEQESGDVALTHVEEQPAEKGALAWQENEP